MNRVLSSLLIIWASFFGFNQAKAFAAGISEPCCEAGGRCEEGNCEEGNCTEVDCSNPDCSHAEGSSAS